MGVDLSSAVAAKANAGVGVPLGNILAHHVRRDANRPAITLNGVTLTRSELDARSNRRARLLAGLGVTQGDLVTIALPNSIEFYETSFAVWKLGATPNVISHKLPDAELSSIVNLADPRLVVGLDPDRLPGKAVLPADSVATDHLSAEPLPTVIAPYWKAMTSGGSTGRPKLIVDHMPGVWDPSVTALGQAIDDTLLNPGPLYHNAPFIGMHYGLFAGGHVVDMGKFDAEGALRLIDAHGVGWVNFVPTMMHRIMRLPEAVRAKYTLKSLRVLFHMAAPCPTWLKRAWIDWIGPDRVYELYAGTERQGATLISGVEWLAHEGSVGRAQPGTRMQILREDGSECGPGEIGEIYFLPDAGRNSSYHYIGAEARARGDWESLGDLGYLDDEGYLYLVDRRVDLILTGGANVYPAEVEAALESHPAVAGAAVIGLPDDDLGQLVHAIVQVRDGEIVTEEEIKLHAANAIAAYKTPRTIELVRDPIRDDAGKVRRSVLREARIVKN